MKPLVYAVLAMSLFPVSALAEGDVLLIDTIAGGAGVAHPRNGVTMDRVRAHFGEPAERIAPVGDPPITRWIYDDFTAYFEFDRVITSVVHR